MMRQRLRAGGNELQFFALFSYCFSHNYWSCGKEAELEETRKRRKTALFSEFLGLDEKGDNGRTQTVHARSLYDMYFEVANLRLGRGGEKPLD